jgi:hypothetical protein
VAQENKKLSRQLDEMKKVMEGFHAEAMNTLERCVQSAETFVTTATTIYHSAISTQRSEGEQLSGDKREGIQGWIPEPTIYEEALDRPDSEPSASAFVASSPTTHASDHREAAKIQRTYKLAIRHYNNRDFARAKVFLQTLQRPETIDKLGNERNELLKMLTTTYCRLDDYRSAEEVLKVDFEGRDQGRKLLVTCYMNNKSWEAAIMVLKEGMSAQTVYEQETIAWKLHAHTEVLFAQGQYDDALVSCDQALDELERFVGIENIQYHMSRALRSRIYKKKGEAFEVDALVDEDMLPEDIEGPMSPSQMS